ncbi:hypothetical protein [Billgrantia montanilacus]|uniref:hypothetical protein n=1 Tax=Billgrantia montanilacus TaxID=2282305 RepID=UPI0015F04728|nr:hypothetical protein [Halomonas montanilacus]
MRKWILLAVINWLRKPANRAKAKNAWSGMRGKKPDKRQSGSNPNQRPNSR